MLTVLREVRVDRLVIFSKIWSYSEPQEGSSNLILIRQEGGTYLYARRDTLPVGFMVPSDIDYSWQRDLGNPVSVQNDLCGLIGVDRVLEQVDVENNEDTARFTPETAGMYYVYIANRKVEQVDVSPTGECGTEQQEI